MGHSISGLIAQCNVLAKLVPALNEQPYFSLEAGFGFLPLDYNNLDDIVGEDRGKSLDGFMYLTPKLIDYLRAVSKNGRIAYVETDYFGGIGHQGAAVFSEGSVPFGPQSSERGAINQALALLGVSATPNQFDQFAAIGLDQYRSNDDYRDDDITD